MPPSYDNDGSAEMFSIYWDLTAEKARKLKYLHRFTNKQNNTIRYIFA